MMKEILIVLVIFSAVIVGISGFYGDLGTTYGKSAISVSSLNKSVSINRKLNSTYQAATNTTTPLSQLPFIGGISDSFWAFIQTSKNIISLLFDVPFLLFDMITNIGSVFGMAGFVIPGWFILMLMGVVLVLFIMFLLNFFRAGGVQ